ncbi:NAD-dependent epimerase/dehydratase family protein [Celeribacter indicus]|uniref:Sterol-4-alpha-carboxylate 3-dehydrogenase,decarboxylating n=1 Tax=Celeribacter indicus TaxID=1208324 RepID=A0A0B5DVE6_9RHOB|nr:NAD(P)-dependent oxidoreductase [Celeribacter indicus]AJE46999.1 Sterol-4-alpha-carboxylate 3-dehydrogenase,decarboxylating [Celeribacter indicus]SDX62225.1 Nucleoside-diphosphate-sugar epimerase [Celeribacter indicus]
MAVFITGVTGLVGARLLPRLVEAGVDCRALVRGGKEVASGVTPVEGDLFDPSTLVGAVKGASDIIHLAAVFRTQDTDLIWKSNVEGTRNLIAAVKTHAPKARFILASTSNVYDVDGTHPGREDDPIDPKQAYPASKVTAEKELQESGLNWAVLRFPFVYGDRDGHLEELPKYAIAGKWHPAKKVSTIHHRDLATGIKFALEGTFDGRIVNIADEAATSIYELAALVGETLEPSSAPLENPWHLHVDGSLARSLGFQPTVRTVYQAVQEKLM